MEIESGLEILVRQGAIVHKFFGSIGAVHVEMQPGVATALMGEPNVDYIEPREWYTLQGSVAPRAAFGAVPAIRSQVIDWGVDAVRAPAAWDSATGAGAKIMVIDTGHEQGHEDLPYVPTGNCGGYYGGCDDVDPWHGTHVLGVAVARNNAYGSVGVAPGTDSTDVHVFGACSDVGVCSNTEVIDALESSHELDVVNMSFGTTLYSAGVAAAVAEAWSEGVVLVAAAGNRPSTASPPSNLYPASYSNVIGVSGVKPDSTFAAGSPCSVGGGATRASNYGAYVDIAAPFWALSTVGDNGYGDEGDSYCGTSFAAPFVSGVAAILRELHPGWSNSQIVSHLFETALPLGDPSKDHFYGWGLVDAAQAVGILRPTPTAPEDFDVEFDWNMCPEVWVDVHFAFTLDEITVQRSEDEETWTTVWTGLTGAGQTDVDIDVVEEGDLVYRARFDTADPNVEASWTYDATYVWCP